MSNIDNILRALLIAAAVANLVSTVHNVIRLRKPDRLAVAADNFLSKAPKYNYMEQLIKEHQGGTIAQSEIMTGYLEWIKENDPDLPTRLMNDYAIMDGMLHQMINEENNPPDES